MQTTKSRPSSLNVPRKTSPVTPRTESKLKSPGSDSDSLSCPSPVRKTPKDRSPNVVDQRSSRSPAAGEVSHQKKRTTKVSELEPQLARLQDELKRANDQLISSESCKKKAQHEADEAKIRFAAVLTELNKTRERLNELSDSEDARIEELRSLSHDRDKAWQSELEAVQKQHSMDRAALASARKEIQWLKTQLNKVSESEASQARHAESANAEISSLRVELTETLERVEKLKSQLDDSRQSESRALEQAGRAQVLLEESKNKVNYLEGLISKFWIDFPDADRISDEIKAGILECDRSGASKNEIDDSKNETSRLRGALKDTLHIKAVYELITHAKMESREREAEMEAKLKESRAEFEKVKTESIEKETELRNELKKSELVMEDLKMSLQSITLEIKKRRENDEILASAEAARVAEREALIENMAEEADRRSRKAERLAEQLHAAQAVGLEMEADMRRLKVQSDQFKKAAEAAAAMLLAGNDNGKYVEQTRNFVYGKTMGSPFSDDEYAVKKNGNVLKRLAMLLKKGQK
ncbi:hypothetical protein OROGR_018711 [Orobanche gracilis]